MYESPLRRGIPWLLTGLLLLLVSTVLYVYDQNRTDKEILAEVESQIQRDFSMCLAYYSSDSLTQNPSQDSWNSCELGYDGAGKLISWTGSSYLPKQKSINNLKDFEGKSIITFDNRTYYQIRKSFTDSTSVILIPIHITYQVSNNFLIPHYFVGSYHSLLYKSKNYEYIKGLNITFSNPDASADIRIKDLRGNPTFSLNNVSVEPFRNKTRYALMIALILGALTLAVYLRLYALGHWSYRYFINVSLFVGVILIRFLMYVFGIPGDFWDMKLFSSNILAFDDYFAPSLGEMTLNIITITILVWLLYTQLFRITNLFYRKIMNRQFLVWPAMMLTLFLSSYLLEQYVSIFTTITQNSQIDIEFSNLFKANIYSFLILFDVGLLLLSVTMIIFLLLKLNILYGRRFGFTSVFVIIQVLAILVCNLYLHQHANWGSSMAITLSIGLFLLAWVVARFPFKQILHHDLLNYLLIILVFSIVVTHNVIKGQEFADKYKAQRIAERVLGSQVDNTVANFSQASFRINEFQETLQEQEQHDLLDNPNEFRDWFAGTFLEPDFKEFEVRLFLFDSEGNRLDKSRDIDPSFPPGADVPLRDIGDSIAPGLYQLPNPDNRYIDLYVGVLNLYLGEDSTKETKLSIELLPNQRETEGLYPSLTLDEDIYNDIKLINSCDHALYREGYLYYKRGKTSFPIYLESDLAYKGGTPRLKGDNYEFVEPIGNKKWVVVRYGRTTLFELLSTFSFIFYFFVLTTLVVIGLPVLALRSLRRREVADNWPLRTKIRMGLLSISILPMIVIILLLSPFIAQRYNDDAKNELRLEAERITGALDQEFINLRNDPFSRITSQRAFIERVEKMKDIMENDINIYDENGRHLASTQPLIFDDGINTDLMNSEAFKRLKDGKESDLVIQEKMGEQEYLSAYRPFIGNNEIPIGYVNVPYLGKQDQLEDQITEFLAYLANIYLLVFLLINVVAVLVSSTITQPLAMIQQRLSSTSLGNVNEPILYDSKDEIGAIVSAYNKMVGQLEESEEKLTQTQRELAWRQMARQVAHEIKNPLTPMKLSIQHLSRAWDENTPRLQKMFPKVMKTLLVQIESMVRIANSFSEFAKMPEPINSRILVNDVLLEVVDLYTQSEEAIWLIDIPQEEFWAYADREQLSRCFTNIMKNGLQAIEENGIIHVSMRVLHQKARIEIKDNGKGMPEDIQRRIFEPNFSTKTSGMGLGLAIVKRIIENAGGDITFESEEGRGTTFIIELPSVVIEESLPAIAEKV